MGIKFWPTNFPTNPPFKLVWEPNNKEPPNNKWPFGNGNLVGPTLVDQIITTSLIPPTKTLTMG